MPSVVVVVVVVVVWFCSLNFSENADCVGLGYKTFLSAVFNVCFSWSHCQNTHGGGFLRNPGKDMSITQKTST